MTKTALMVTGLAGVLSFGLACFGLFGPPVEPGAGSTVEACAGLSGEALADCERRHGG